MTFHRPASGQVPYFCGLWQSIQKIVPGSKGVDLAAVFQQSLPGQSELDQVGIQSAALRKVPPPGVKQSRLLQIQQMLLGKAARRYEFPAGIGGHIQLILQCLHGALRKKQDFDIFRQVLL